LRFEPKVREALFGGEHSLLTSLLLTHFLPDLVGWRGCLLFSAREEEATGLSYQEYGSLRMFQRGKGEGGLPDWAGLQRKNLQLKGEGGPSP
jgi:hypothetical protein